MSFQPASASEQSPIVGCIRGVVVNTVLISVNPVVGQGRCDLGGHGRLAAGLPSISVGVVCQQTLQNVFDPFSWGELRGEVIREGSSGLPANIQTLRLLTCE